jgi:hypothetical protein
VTRMQVVSTALRTIYATIYGPAAVLDSCGMQAVCVFGYVGLPDGYTRDHDGLDSNQLPS